MPIDSSSNPYDGGKLEIDLDAAGTGAAGKGLNPSEDLDDDLESAGKGAGAAEPIELDPVDKSGGADDLDGELDAGGDDKVFGTDDLDDGAQSALDDPGAGSDDSLGGKFGEDDGGDDDLDGGGKFADGDDLDDDPDDVDKADFHL